MLLACGKKAITAIARELVGFHYGRSTQQVEPKTSDA